MFIFVLQACVCTYCTCINGRVLTHVCMQFDCKIAEIRLRLGKNAAAATPARTEWNNILFAFIFNGGSCHSTQYSTEQFSVCLALYLQRSEKFEIASTFTFRILEKL